MAKKLSWIDRAMQRFGFVRVRGNQTKVLPKMSGKNITGQASGAEKTFGGELGRFWDFFLQQNYVGFQTLQDRMARYKEFKIADANCPLISRTVNLYVGEALQSDAQDNIITVYGKDKAFDKFATEFYSNIGIDANMLEDLTRNIVLCGDGFLAHHIDGNKGIVEVSMVSPEDVTERIEFTPIDVAKKLQGSYLPQIANNHDILTKLYNKASEDHRQFGPLFKSYLLGFRCNPDNVILAPWEMTHFRVMTSDNEFRPYGRPILLNTLAPYKRLDTGMMMMALARATSFPTKVFGVKLAESTSPVEAWMAVENARDQYHNQVMSMLASEKEAVNSEIWVPQDVIEVERLDMSVDLDDIEDIEFQRDDLITATGLPKGLLISDRSGWNNPGMALLQQNKEFARFVYKIQTVIIQGLVDLLKTHLAITGQFDGYETEFEIRMNYPVVEQSSDMLKMKEDTLSLANTILDTIAEIAAVSASDIPLDIIKKVFSEYSFLDQEDVHKWFDDIEKAKKKEPEIEIDPMANMMPPQRGATQRPNLAAQMKTSADVEREAFSDKLDKQAEKDAEDREKNAEKAEKEADKAEKDAEKEEREKEKEDREKEQEDKEKEREKAQKAKQEESAKRKLIEERITPEVVRESYFRAKKEKQMWEGKLHGKHFVCSFNSSREKKIMYEMISEYLRFDSKLHD